MKDISIPLLFFFNNFSTRMPKGYLGIRRITYNTTAEESWLIIFQIKTIIIKLIKNSISIEIICALKCTFIRLMIYQDSCSLEFISVVSIIIL
ncbi:hypothetical protein BpHYR1_026887 [Brachionus plicatilis]|uniref:Uncharacterized protein n=1 Tax=Brachionus plicatilis TaxID=10195 RepID=A0A3M7T8D4_BRAPC|nr:hypothetical protein BpHYR1_026887 [Brachionus plicatilis]